MTRLIALSVAVAAGCAANPSPSGDDFDADGWLDRASIAAVGPVMGDPSLDLAKQFAAELDEAAGWTEVCETRWDPEIGEMITDDESSWASGTYTIHDVPGGTVVAVTCDIATTVEQGFYAFVHITEGGVTPLVGQSVDFEGEPFGPPTATHTTPLFDGDATFSTLMIARNIGDCGIYSTYEITAPGAATLLEARARECDGQVWAGGPPERWPIVYSR